ncbi:MAG: TonB-dependent receptor domain-containing protein [Pseudomarimonas sp.]
MSDQFVSSTARLSALSVAMAMAMAWPAQAENVRQPEVVVTATRTPIAQDAALASVSVIDRAAIEQSGSSDVLTLLRSQAGVDIVRGGGLGQQTSVFLRGSNSNHVLVLIDGVRVASATTGAYAWEQLPLAQIERIEIVRGPRAALFGSDAIGGVVQIFTRRANGPSGMLGAASHNTWLGEAGFGQRSGRFQFGVRAALTDSAGFNAQNPSGFSFDPDDDGYQQQSVNADIAWTGEQLRLDGQLLHSESEIEFDRGESSLDAASANLKLAGGGDHPWSIQLANSRENLHTAAFFSRFETRRTQVEAQRAQRVGEAGEWLYGLSLIDDDGRNVDTFGGTDVYDDNRRQRAVFGSWRDSAAGLDWELGARHDHYDSFGGETSLQAALGWRIEGGPRLRASGGEGFRAPTLNELYSPGFSGFFAGNPELGPERSRGFELGVDWQGERFDLSLSAYRNQVKGLIDFSGGETFQAINIRRATLRGLELEARAPIGEWQLTTHLGWQQARDEGTDSALLRRPTRKAGASIEHAMGRGRFGLDLHAVSARPEFGGALPGYALFGGWLRWPVANALSVDLRLDNVFDRDYTLTRGFNTVGATASLQLRWSPE